MNDKENEIYTMEYYSVFFTKEKFVICDNMDEHVVYYVE